MRVLCCSQPLLLLLLLLLLLQAARGVGSYLPKLQALAHAGARMEQRSAVTGFVRAVQRIPARLHVP
jgi:hypothetical protein